MAKSVLCFTSRGEGRSQFDREPRKGGKGETRKGRASRSMFFYDWRNDTAVAPVMREGLVRLPR